jgi:hypothetical protein
MGRYSHSYLTFVTCIGIFLGYNISNNNYDKSQMTTKEDPEVVGTSKKVNEEKSKKCVDVLKSSISDEDNEKK